MEDNKEFISKFEKAPFTFLVVGVNLIVFIVLEFLGGTTNSEIMLNHGVLNSYKILHEGEWYRLFTCMFLHFGLEHLFNNMLLLFFLGQLFEQAVGTTRCAAIYLGSGLCGSFLSFVYQCLMNENDLIAGASGAIFGIVGGMLIVVVLNRGKYKGISTKRMLLMTVLTLYFGFVSAGTDNVGHVGGLVSGIILTLILYGIPVLVQKIRQR